MSKQKGEDFYVDDMRESGPIDPDRVPGGGDVDQRAEDRMAKARAAAAKKRKKRGKPPVPIGEMQWLLVGFKREPYTASIIGTAANRFRLRHKWDALKEIAFQAYDGVFVMRGKRFDVNSL